ncbi:MAG: STAS domain-containing protein [Candidatus Tyrphobacter sp.]
MPQDDLTIQRELSGTTTIFRLWGSLDVATSPSLKEALTKASAQGHHDIVVDLTQVDFLDSTGLGALMGAHRRAVESEGRLSLIVHEGPISRLLTITGLSRIFSIFASSDDALARIGAIE